MITLKEANELFNQHIAIRGKARIIGKKGITAKAQALKNVRRGAELAKQHRTETDPGKQLKLEIEINKLLEDQKLLAANMNELGAEVHKLMRECRGILQPILNSRHIGIILKIHKENEADKYWIDQLQN
jgi:TATA-binding protein-associated factor Taf7